MYVVQIFLLVNPYLFPFRQGRPFIANLIFIFATAVFIPIVSILMMKETGLINSLRMKERTERIGPLIVTSIAYLWLFLNIRTHDNFPAAFSAFILGALISLFLAFFINNFSKISLHAVGMGGLLIAVSNVIFTSQRAYAVITIGENVISIHNLFLLALLVLIIGVVLSSRLFLKAHQLKDVAGGLLVGIVGQLIAIKFF